VFPHGLSPWRRPRRGRPVRSSSRRAGRINPDLRPICDEPEIHSVARWTYPTRATAVLACQARDKTPQLLRRRRNRAIAITANTRAETAKTTVRTVGVTRSRTGATAAWRPNTSVYITVSSVAPEVVRWRTSSRYAAKLISTFSGIWGSSYFRWGHSLGSDSPPPMRSIRSR
jgi:hypothetical protein